MQELSITQQEQKPGSILKDGKRIHLAECLLLSVALIWGTNFSVIKILYEYIHPLAFTAVRMTIATLSMLLILKLRGVRIKISAKDIPSVIGLGIISTTGYQLLFVLGLAKTRAGNAGLLLSLTPVFAYLIGILLRRVSFSFKGLLGILLSTLGVTAIVFFGNETISFGGTWVGDLMIIGAAFCWGWYTGASTTLLSRYGTLETTFLAMLFGVIFLLSITFPWLIVQNWSEVPVWAWLTIAGSAWLAIVYSYFVWSYAIKTIGVARTAVIGNITPVVALLAAWILIDEEPVLAQGVSILLILAGIFIVRQENDGRIRPPEGSR